MTDRPKFLSIESVARELDVSVPTVRRLIGRGDLPAIKVGKQVRVSVADLDDFIAGNVVTRDPIHEAADELIDRLTRAAVEDYIAGGLS